MRELIKLFFENTEDILYSESNNLILLINQSGDILDCNDVFCKEKGNLPRANINQFLVMSSYKNLFDILAKDLKTSLKIRLNFAFKDRNIPSSYDCWIIPLKNKKKLIYGEMLSPLGQKEAEEYLKLTNDLCQTTRILQKNKFELEKLNIELAEKEASLKNYSEKLEEMVDERTEELQNAREKLIRQEKLAIMGQFTGSISHEIKNPLNIISNAIYFLKIYSESGDDKVKEYLEIISSEVMRIDKIVTDLRDFSRIKSSAEKNRTGLCHILRNVMKRLSVPKKIKLYIDVSDELADVYIDIIHIEQVLVNLITNAFQSIDNEGEVFITAGEDNDFIFLSVKDTGCGIGKENLDKIFEPLFTTKNNGIGLGLVITKNLIEINGGKIRLESTEGNGTTFTVFLPKFSGRYYCENG